jgi:recombination protein RecA
MAFTKKTVTGAAVLPEVKIEPPAPVVQIEEPVKMVALPKKSSELIEILKQISKDKGSQTVIKGSQAVRVGRLPTGIFEFDYSTGGGFPEGRYSIVYGPESSGKTNVCYCAAAIAQKRPEPCNKVVWVDLEGTFDPEWAAQFGVNVEELILVKPSYGEEAVDLVDALIRAEDVAFMVVDSLAVVLSTKEIEQSAEKFDVGTAAILVKRMCNKLVLALSQEGKRGHTPAVVLINQTRMKIGVMFGDPETMPGGQTMKFLSSLTVRLYGKNLIMKDVNPEVPAFKDTNAVIKKAKVPINRQSFEYQLCMYAHGSLSVGESDSWGKVSAMLKEMGVLAKAEKGGGWLLFGKHSPTLVGFQDDYESDKDFAIKCQNTVTAVASSILVAADGAAK